MRWAYRSVTLRWLTTVVGFLLPACGGGGQQAPGSPSTSPPPPQSLQVTSTVFANGTNLHDLSIRSGGSINVTLTWQSTSLNLDLYVTDANCSGLPLVQCPVLAQSASTSGNREQVSRNAVAGERYRVWVDNVTTSVSTSYTLELSSAAAGDLSASRVDFIVGTDKTSISLNRPCASLPYFVAPTGGFSGPVTLTCTGLPAGASCGFGPNGMAPASSGTLSGMTLALDPAQSGTFRITVRATGGGLTREAPLDVTASAVALPAVRNDAMIVVGCAGYQASVRGPDTVQEFAAATISAMGTTGSGSIGICTDGGFTRSEADGWFVFQISNSSRCSYRDNTNLDFSTEDQGRRATCVSLPFVRNTLHRAVLVARNGSC